jgi:hypothetical protein
VLKLQFFPSNSKRKRAFCSVAITLPPFHARLPRHEWLNALYYEKSLKKLNLGWRNFSQKSSTVQFIPREREVKYEIVNLKCFFEPFRFNLKRFFKPFRFNFDVFVCFSRLSVDQQRWWMFQPELRLHRGLRRRVQTVFRLKMFHTQGNKQKLLPLYYTRMFYISHNGWCC